MLTWSCPWHFHQEGSSFVQVLRYYAGSAVRKKNSHQDQFLDLIQNHKGEALKTLLEKAGCPVVWDKPGVSPKTDLPSRFFVLHIVLLCDVMDLWSTKIWQCKSDFVLHMSLTAPCCVKLKMWRKKNQTCTLGPQVAAAWHTDLSPVAETVIRGLQITVSATGPGGCFFLPDCAPLARVIEERKANYFW